MIVTVESELTMSEKPEVKHDRIVFFDTTLRDGEQSPGCTMHAGEKLRMAHQLAALGVDVLEAGFAIASDGDLESIRTIAREVRGPRITSLARCKREDIEAAARAIEPAPVNRIHVFLASSDLHLEAKLRITREQALEQAAEAVALACTYSDNVEFSAEDATRSDPGFLRQIVTVAVQAGATTINLPDTVGYTTPDEYKALFARMQGEIPGADDIIFSTHCHNDLGMAVANSLAGVEGGARQIECTINGIGERAGNAALEEIAAALATRRDKFPYSNGIAAQAALPHQPPARRVDQLRLLAQQGGRRSQRLRARIRHPPARHAGQPPHLRDHDAGVSRRPVDQPRTRQTQRPPPARTASRRTRPPAHSLATRRGLPALHHAGRPQKIHLRPGPHRPA